MISEASIFRRATFRPYSPCCFSPRFRIAIHVAPFRDSHSKEGIQPVLSAGSKDARDVHEGTWQTWYRHLLVLGYVRPQSVFPTFARLTI